MDDLDRGFDPRAYLPESLAIRFDALRRDVSMLIGDLTGKRSPTFAKRTALARHQMAAAAPREKTLIAARPLRITRVVRETKDAISLWLVDPFGRRIPFEPGQFFTVLVTSPTGEVFRRAYSISSMPDEDGAASEVRITIKRIEGGRASNYLNDTAREGDSIKVLGPSGSFTVPKSDGSPRHLVLFAGGSGITPLASIARTTLAREPESRVSLVYGNRGEEDIIFREELAALEAEHGGRFVLRNVLSAPPEGFSGTVGILDRDTVGAEIDALADLDHADFFVCGPAPMMAAAREALELRGASPSRIREERFSSPAKRGAPVLPDKPQPIRLRVQGAEREVTAAPGQTLLEAGLAASLPMPFSCTMGGCGACKVKLIEGTVASEEPNCLNEEETKAGLVLACVSRATSPCRIEVP